MFLPSITTPHQKPHNKPHPEPLINHLPNSQSLDSLRTVFHQTAVNKLLELELAYSKNLTPPSPIPHPKPSRSCYDIHDSLRHPRFPPATLAHHHHLVLATKTPYPPPNPVHPIPYLLQSSITPPNPPRNTLRLIHVSLVARHGTRNPTNNCLNRLTVLESWLKSAITPNPKWLCQWSNILDSYRRDPGSLTIEGEQELEGIGSRFAQLYARPLQDVGSTLRIRSSYKARAISSAKSFLDGYLDACSEHDLPQPVTLLDSEHQSEASDSSLPQDIEICDTDPSESAMSDLSVASSASSLETASISSTEEDYPVEILPNGNDAVLRYYDRNPEYATYAVQHKALTRKDLPRVALRKHAEEMAARISKGLGASCTMEMDLVRSVSEACAFDVAHGRIATSPFCRVLTPKDTAILELFETRHRPYCYAHESFKAVPAPLVADLAASLRASVETPNNPSAHAADLRFAHAETLVPLLLLLGITTNGLAPDHPEYGQGLSAISPFAANLAIELYEELDEWGDVRHFVRFRLHERYVESIPKLGENGANGIVELEHLLSFFDDILAEGKRRYK